MPQDAFTLKHLCSELNTLLTGAKVNRITQSNQEEIVFTVYTGKGTEKLLISVNPSLPRIGVVNKENESLLTAPNFCMLLRKHLISSKILSVETVNFDRVIKIEFLSSLEFSDRQNKTLYLEIMGRYSNAILTEGGFILGACRGINSVDNLVRPLIVGGEYKFPPLGEKLAPNDDGLIDYFNQFNGEDFYQYLLNGVRGLAQSTAKEFERYLLDKVKLIKEHSGEKIVKCLKEFIYIKNVLPCVLIKDGKVKDYMVFPYTTCKGEYISFDSLIQAENYFFSKKSEEKEFSSKKEGLISAVNSLIKKLNKKQFAILERERETCSIEDNRIKGELILSNIYKIKRGDKTIEVDNYYTQTKLKIELDEYLSPSENAERYYKKYNKQKRTLVALKPQKELVEGELSYLSSVLDEINIAEDLDGLELIRSELLEQGIIKLKESKVKQSQKSNKQNQKPLCAYYLINGFTVKVGRNNIENDRVTFKSKDHDIWLHAKNYHSSHVVIETQNNPVPMEVIVKSAEICAYFSKGRDGGKVEISYTEKKNVKKPNGAKPGFCIYENYQTVIVEAKKHSEMIKRC